MTEKNPPVCLRAGRGERRVGGAERSERQDPSNIISHLSVRTEGEIKIDE